MISAGMGLLQGVSSMFATKPVQDRSSQIGAAAYNNTLGMYKTRMLNEYRQRAYERKVAQVTKQFDENFAAANASFQTEQAKYAEQMMQFAFQKEGLLNELMQAEGVAAATVVWRARRVGFEARDGGWGHLPGGRAPTQGSEEGGGGGYGGGSR